MSLAVANRNITLFGRIDLTDLGIEIAHAAPEFSDLAALTCEDADPSARSYPTSLEQAPQGNWTVAEFFAAP